MMKLVGDNREIGWKLQWNILTKGVVFVRINNGIKHLSLSERVQLFGKINEIYQLD